jgi:anti-sigma regulatory factor (Ser/Thr protein kinase)
MTPLPRRIRGASLDYRAKHAGFSVDDEPAPSLERGHRVNSRMFPRSAAAVGRAPSFVAGCIGGCTPEQADDIRVCVSELVTNALQHTPVGRRLLVRIIRTDSVVRVEVHDASIDTPHVCTPADTDDRGRGLMLVSTLADDWGVSDRTGPGKVVWADFKVRKPAEAM